MSEKIKLVFPLDGDMLNEHDGTAEGDRLRITVRISAPAGCKLSVNGADARLSDSLYSADVRLDQYRNTLVVEEANTGFRESYVVYRLRNAVNKYRLSVDDNIWFLRDIARNRLAYRSIFENPYLGFFKQMHELYGTKVQFNLYYETDGFDLAEMPDKYKEEWRANAHWLRLTFHALRNDPAKPYKDAPAGQIGADCARVNAQIIRFAGEELMEPATTVHWGEATREGCRALRKLGFRALAGYFEFEAEGPVVSYYLNRTQTEHLNGCDYWKDDREDIIFVKIDLVLDSVSKDEISPRLNRMLANPRQRGFVELMIHEQYFYPEYKAYQPDFREKVETAIKWAAEHGYQPAFLSECLFD